MADTETGWFEPPSPMDEQLKTLCRKNVSTYFDETPNHPLHPRLVELWNSHDEAGWSDLRDILAEMETPRYCVQVEQVYAEKARNALRGFPPMHVKYLWALTGDQSSVAVDHE